MLRFMNYVTMTDARYGKVMAALGVCGLIAAAGIALLATSMK